MEGGSGEGNLGRMLLDLPCCISATYFSCLQTQQTGTEPTEAYVYLLLERMEKLTGSKGTFKTDTKYKF